MKKHYDSISREAEASGLQLAQLRLGYEQNPTPFALLQIVSLDAKPQDAVFVYVNPAFTRLAGHQAKSLVGRGYFSTIGKTDSVSLQRLAEIAGGSSSAVLSDFRDILGRYLQIDCFPVAPGFLGCLVRDVSDRHYISEKETEEFSKLQQLVEGGVLVTSLPEPYQLIYANETLCASLGYPSMLALQRQIAEHSLFSVLHPDDVPKVKTLIAGLGRQPSLHSIVQAQTKGGGYRWFSVQGKRASLSSDRPVVITILHDITAEMNQVMRENKISHQMIQNISSQYYATYYVNADSGTYYAVRQTQKDLRGDLPTTGSYHEALDYFIHTYVHPDDRIELSQLLTISSFREIASCIRGHRIHTLQFRRKFGTQYEWVEALISMDEPSDDTIQDEQIVTLAFRNIHNEKLAEMEKRYLEVFSYAVTHSYEMVLEYDQAKGALYELKLGENGLYRLPRYDTTIDERIRFATIHIHPDDINRFLAEISPETVQNVDLSHRITFEYRRRGEGEDAYRWCSYSIRAFTQGGRQLCILFVKDIHDTKIRHMREQQRLQSAVVDAERRIHEKNSQLITYYGKTIELMSSVVEYRSLESGEHVRRIKNYTEELLRAAAALFPEQELTEEKIRSITEASALHDVGKIGVPDNILLKPAKLTPEEFEIMKRHTVIGADIAREIPCVTEKADEYYYGYNIARYHHERFDGRGYPEGLQGEDIPFCAQIVAIADVYDALTTVRVYKGAYSTERACQMILNGECGIFSPRMLSCFDIVRDRFAEIQAGICDANAALDD